MAASFLAALLPSRLVADLTAQMGIGRLVLEVGGIAAVMWLCDAASSAMLSYCGMEGDFTYLHSSRIFARKMMDVDYDCLEDDD